MEPAKAVKEYKDEVAKLKVKIGEYAKKEGQLTLEKDWAVGKLQSLDSSYKKELIDQDEDKSLSVLKQCELVDYNRSNLFYIPMVNPGKDAIKKYIEKVFAPQEYFLASLTARDTKLWLYESISSAP